MPGDGRSQFAMEVLPGEKLQFLGGQAKITDHGNQEQNKRIVMKVLRTPGLTVMPTTREEDGWEDWFPGWIAQCGDNQPCVATVIMHERQAPSEHHAQPGDVNFGLLRRKDVELEGAIPFITDQAEIERLRVEDAVPEPIVPEVKPISWEDIAMGEQVYDLLKDEAVIAAGETAGATAAMVDGYIASFTEPEAPKLTLPKPKSTWNHKATCKCPTCVKWRRESSIPEPALA
jgi:hypothetical protein